MAVIVAGLLWQQDFLVAIGVGISAGGAITSALTRRAKGDVPWLIGIAFSLAGLALVAWQVVGS